MPRKKATSAQQAARDKFKRNQAKAIKYAKEYQRKHPSSSWKTAQKEGWRKV